ncbi:hypothetical protein AK830_g666 [Neonectria ditissima]|uniref:Uncharacterized protein n=1 Tax=Neonectria ditissima TaxID=78410 RepID=A0A0P7BKP0_9HYPO|nr:hypothetical protein AK830_g666 [Neonectria ditissima]
MSHVDDAHIHIHIHTRVHAPSVTKKGPRWTESTITDSDSRDKSPPHRSLKHRHHEGIVRTGPALSFLLQIAGSGNWNSGTAEWWHSGTVAQWSEWWEHPLGHLLGRPILHVLTPSPAPPFFLTCITHPTLPRPCSPLSCRRPCRDPQKSQAQNLPPRPPQSQGQAQVQGQACKPPTHAKVQGQHFQGQHRTSSLHRLGTIDWTRSTKYLLLSSTPRLLDSIYTPRPPCTHAPWHGPCSKPPSPSYPVAVVAFPTLRELVWIVEPTGAEQATEPCSFSFKTILEALSGSGSGFASLAARSPRNSPQLACCPGAPWPAHNKPGPPPTRTAPLPASLVPSPACSTRRLLCRVVNPSPPVATARRYRSSLLATPTEIPLLDFVCAKSEHPTAIYVSLTIWPPLFSQPGLATSRADFMLAASAPNV